MKISLPLRWRIALINAGLAWLGINLHAQTVPTILTQPVSQTVSAGANVTFMVTTAGAGPFTYEWRFNGAGVTNQFIATVAGNGVSGSAGDAGLATNASLYSPSGLAVDTLGNRYIADYGLERIRKVDVNGIISTVAGNGSAGFGGDGGPATNASLDYPYGLTADLHGNLYIADSGNHRVRKVDSNGIITTVAGDGANGYSGDGGGATNASLSDPRGVAVDRAGNLYIADFFNHCIRRVDPSGYITTVAGNGLAGDSGDGGAATNANLNYPVGVAMDANDRLYIADTFNSRIRLVDTNGEISTVAGEGGFGYGGDGGSAVNATLDHPSGVAVDTAGNVYIADDFNNRIRRVDPNGVITTMAGNGFQAYAGDGGAATNASLADPAGVTVDAAGNVLIADTGNARVREVSYPRLPALYLSQVGARNAGDYTVVIANSQGGVTSAVATLTVQAPPIITASPASQSVVAGNEAVLSVTVAGSGPFEYDWYLAGTNLIQNGALATLALPGLTPGAAGDYTVVVTNPYGSATSQVATLTVGFPPTIITPPASVAVLPGTSATFAVSETGTGPFNYEWQFNGVALPNHLDTVAGNGDPAYAGDGGAANLASLNYPAGVMADNAGNWYIADELNHAIRRVAANGIITTVAGNGTPGYAGDGGPATNASLNFPAGVAVDAAGNIFVADQFNNLVRKIGANGIITTFAGTGAFGSGGDSGMATNADLAQPTGVAFDATGNLYIADSSNHRVRQVDPNGIITTVAGNGVAGFSGDGGPAAIASLNYPAGIAVDAAGNLYVADESNQRIRKVDAAGIITTAAGNGRAGFAGDGGAATNASLSGPVGVACAANGNLYIADGANNRIRQVDAGGFIATVTGDGSPGDSGDGGAANAASLYDPAGVCLDAAGQLYIADSVNNRVRRVGLASEFPALTLPNVEAGDAGDYRVIITSPYGSVTSALATLTVTAPPVITVPPVGQIVAAGGHPIFSVAVAGSGPFGYQWYHDGASVGPQGTDSLLTLAGVAADAGNYMVVVTNAYGSVTSAVACLAVLVAQPMGRTILANGNAEFSVTVAGPGPFDYQWRHNGTNLLITPGITTVAGDNTPGYSGDGGAATNASLNFPAGVALDAAGNLYVADESNQRIRKVGTNGLIMTVAGNGVAAYSGDGGAATNASLNGPSGVAVDAAGNLYIADQFNNCARKVDTNGIITTVAGQNIYGYSGDGGAATNASLANPSGVALDADGNLYIADELNQRIRKVDRHGVITTVAGNGTAGYSGDGGAATNASLNYPAGVACDAHGNLYVADYHNNTVRRVGTNGVIAAVAGEGIRGFSGDGGSATLAKLYDPTGVTADAAGNLYISDHANNRVRRADTNGVITTVAGNGNPGYAGDGGAATNAALNFLSGVALDAQGNLYIADQGNSRIREVNLVMNSTFAITNASPGDAGDYSVVITSAYGSVTSAVATLTLAVPPPIIMLGADFGFMSNRFGFSVSGAIGQTIVVEGSTNLTSWIPLFTNAVGSNSFYFSDPGATTYPWRFYRARVP